MNGIVAALLVALVLFPPCAAWAQDARTALENAARASGAAGLKSIQITGSGTSSEGSPTSWVFLAGGGLNSRPQPCRSLRGISDGQGPSSSPRVRGAPSASSRLSATSRARAIGGA